MGCPLYPPSETCRQGLFLTEDDRSSRRFRCRGVINDWALVSLSEMVPGLDVSSGYLAKGAGLRTYFVRLAEANLHYLNHCSRLTKWSQKK